MLSEEKQLILIVSSCPFHFSSCVWFICCD